MIQSTIVHTLLLLLLAVCVTATEPHRPQVRLALGFLSPATTPSELDGGVLLEPLDELPDAASAQTNSDDTVGENVVAQLAAGDSLAADSVAPVIDLVSFEQPETRTEASIDELLREVPAGISSGAQRPRTLTPASRQRRGDGVGGPVGGTRIGQGGGIGGEMGRRLAAAGAQTGDVQVSIAWEGVDDIDVHVQVEPLQGGMFSKICWMNRLGLCGGMLDVDANAHPRMLTPRPVENVFWAKGQAPYGRYTVAVHHFRNWSGQVATPVEVAVLVDGELKRFYPVATYGQNLKVVFSVERRPPGQSPATGYPTASR